MDDELLDLSQDDLNGISASVQSKAELVHAKRIAKTAGNFLPITFKGQAMGQIDGRYEVLTELQVAKYVLTRVAPGLARSKVKDIYYTIYSTAPDKTDELAHLIGFGGKVWDMEKLDWRDDVSPENVVYRVQYEPNEKHKALSYKFVKELANGDPDVARDILVSVAPLLMATRPDGVIWFLGGGANGKSALVHLLYKIFGRQLAGFDVKQLEDGKVAPMLNGKLGNVVRESFSGYIENTDIYKSIGTHEEFTVRRLGTNEDIPITGDLHHIFSTNAIPSFADKSDGVSRRTWTIPFNNKFKSDPTFEERTFTKDFIEGFLYLIIEATRTIREFNYNYENIFGDITNNVRLDYQLEANSAEAYFEEMVEAGMVAFTGFGQLHNDYMQWCADNGHAHFRVRQFAKVGKKMGFERQSYRKLEVDDNDNNVGNWYRIPGDWNKEDTERFSLSRLGPLRLARSTVDLEEQVDEVEKKPAQLELGDLPDGF